MDKILITRVNPINYVCENMINDLSKEIDKHILKSIMKKYKNNLIK